MRAREFLMKDAYSFHSSREDMVREFELMEETYKRIFRRLGLDFRVVEADSGAIGGSGSKEFMILADSGEDTIMVCESCEFGANVEVLSEENSTCPECGSNLKRHKGYRGWTHISAWNNLLKANESRISKPEPEARAIYYGNLRNWG